MTLNFLIDDPLLVVQNYVITVIVVRTLAAPSRWGTGVRQTDSFLSAVTIVHHTRTVEQRTLVGNRRHAVHLVTAKDGRRNTLLTLSVSVDGFYLFPVNGIAE